MNIRDLVHYRERGSEREQLSYLNVESAKAAIIPQAVVFRNAVRAYALLSVVWFYSSANPQNYNSMSSC